MPIRLQFVILGFAATLAAACSIQQVTFLSTGAGGSSGAPDAQIDAGAEETPNAPPDATFDAGPADATFDAGPGDATFDAGPADVFDAGPDDAFDAGPADAGDDACSATSPCQPVCGDGKMQPGEECDDANTMNGDGCEANCTLPRCGNEILDPNEQCDDGTETARCNANCTVSACGDGIVNRPAGESCDDRNTDVCDPNCQIIGCSNSDQVPAMTSPTLPSGIVTQSGSFDTIHDGWQAFDSNNGTMWISAPGETPAWLGYEWQDGKRSITSYAITFVDGSFPSRAPQNWTFEGWDGASWIVLDSRRAETGWFPSERRVYPVASPGYYAPYRLVISDDNDPTPGVFAISIGSLDLMGCPP